MKNTIATIFCLCSIGALSQKNNIKLTAGRVLFGTGDIPGYGVNIEYSKPLLKSPHFLLGSELSFEHGSKRPDFVHTTLNEFLFGVSFYSTTSISLGPKLSYYPLNRTFLKGLNITGGLTAGYTDQSRELYAHYEPDPGAQTGTRTSTLEYINQAIFGYRITAGYEWSFKKFLVGGRLGFDNYTNGDINTLIGLKGGYHF